MNESNNQNFNHLKIHSQYSICEGAVRIDDLKNFSKDNKIKWKPTVSYALFDAGNSALGAIHSTFIFAVYFSTVIMPEGGSVAWAYMTGITAIMVALIAPLLGSYADSSGKFKELIVLFVTLGAFATGLLWFAQPNDAYMIYAIILSAISIFFLESSFIFYNAILGKIIHLGHIGALSGLAWGGGYIGSVIALLIVLSVFIMPEKNIFDLDKSQSEHVRATMLFAASWAIIFSLPMMFYLPSFTRKKIRKILPFQVLKQV